ncbi:MAG TPA: hypothetical protein VIF39_13310 [Hyphomicrobium sp.]|jgi:DNA invertase Pin-like site-specific DNA recombinase
MLNVLGSVAEFDRSMMLERHREGIVKAKGEGEYNGRAPTARARTNDGRHLLADGIGVCEVATRLGSARH